MKKEKKPEVEIYHFQMKKVTSMMTDMERQCFQQGIGFVID